MNNNVGQLEKSELFWNSILSGNIRHDNSIDEDYMFTHILNCIRALTCLLKGKGRPDDLTKAKREVFWGSVKEIANDQKDWWRSEIKNPLNIVLSSFPRMDGRMWLPLHFAVALPYSSISNIETIFTADPGAIKLVSDDFYHMNPCHLAVSTICDKSKLAIIRQFQNYYPQFGLSLAYESNTPLHLAVMSTGTRTDMVHELAHFCPAALESVNDDGNTPLHLAVKYLRSVELIRELAQLRSAALEIVNEDGNTPLHMAVGQSESVEVVRELVRLYPDALNVENADGLTPVATVAAKLSEPLSILEVLLEAAPEAARIACPLNSNNLPLHMILSRRKPCKELVPVMVTLYAAYKEAVNISNDDGILPVHYAAQNAPFEVMKLIAEDNPSNLSVIVPMYGSVAHLASQDCNMEKLRYIQSIAPQLFFSLDSASRTPLHYIINEDDVNHSFRKLLSPLSAASDALRFLLRHWPSLATARDSNNMTFYDYLPAVLVYARRLLLMAGASSLHPGVLQEMNYAARRNMLFLFFSPAVDSNIFCRIRHAAGDMSLMRTVASFL